MKKKFSFIYPVTKRNDVPYRIGGQMFEHVADLLIEGEAHLATASSLNNICNTYKFQVTKIMFEGKNFFANPEVFDSMENINAACLNHVEGLFRDRISAEAIPRLYPALAKVITLPLRLKVK